MDDQFRETKCHPLDLNLKDNIAPSSEHSSDEETTSDDSGGVEMWFFGVDIGRDHTEENGPRRNVGEESSLSFFGNRTKKCFC